MDESGRVDPGERDEGPVRLETLLAESVWVRALARSLVRDPAVADDIVQETWIAALEHPPLAGRPVRPWLRRVVGNFARMRMRSERARSSRERTAVRGEGVAGPEELYERVETQRMLAKVVLEIDEPFRSTLVLRYYEGLTSAEIARRTGAPEATVRWRHMRGLELLRERLDSGHGGERKAWLTLLLPLCGGTARRAAGAGGLPWVAGLLALLAVVLIVAVERFAHPLGEAAVATSPEPAAQRAAQVPSQRDEVATADMPETAVGPRPQALPIAVLARLLDEDGAPLAGATLSLLLDGERSTALAEPDGAVRLERAALESPRLADVVAEAPAHLRRIERAVLSGGEVHLGELVLARSGAVAGVVVDSAGRPLAGGTVRVETIGSRWSAFAVPPLEEARHLGSLLPEGAPQARTDESGRYRIDGLPEGYARLWIGRDGLETVWIDDVAVLGGSTVTAPPARLSEPDPAHCIEGAVLGPDGSPVANADVECGRVSIRPLFFRGSPNVIRARADERGRFRVCVDPASRYDVSAADPERAFRPTVASPIEAGEREVELRLARWLPLEVVVLDPQRRVVSDPEIELLDARDGRPLESETLRWREGARLAPYTAFLVEARHPSFGRARAGPLEASAAPPLVELAFAASPRLRGRVVDDGLPIGGARVELIAASSGARALLSERGRAGETFAVLLERPRRSTTTISDGQGAFEAAVEPGTSWWVRVEAPGHAAAMSGPISAESNEDLEIELVDPGALEGSLLASDGRAVAGRVVGVSRGDGYVATRRVGPDGRFRFDDLSPGAWQVRTVAEEALGWAALELAPGAGPATAPLWDVQVESGSTARFDLVAADPFACLLEGRLAFDGASVGPWTVEVRRGQRAPLRTVVDPRGRFAIELDAHGEWLVRAFSSRRSGPAYELTERLTIGGPRAELVRDWSASTLELRGGRPGAHVEARWSDGGATLAVAHAFDETGACTLAPLPSGKLDVACEGLAPIRIELAPGERRVLSLER